MICACSILCMILAASCQKKNNGVWDDHKTAGKLKTNDSRMLWGNDEGQSLAFEENGFTGPNNEDFIPLKEDDLKNQFADGAVPQPAVSPGEEGSGLPGIDRFQNPSSHLASVFKTVYFNTDDHILRGQESLAVLDNMANYLKAHPNTYLFIEGHCDQRGPEAYNLSLGARRANYVRTMLVKNGVNLNQIHTVSYGKEKPIAFGNDSEAWSKNRRAQFKIFQK